MYFAERAAMQSYKSEVEAITEKNDNVQAEMRSMKSGIDSIQSFMKQLQLTGTMPTKTSRTEPSSLSGNTSDPNRVARSGYALYGKSTVMTPVDGALLRRIHNQGILMDIPSETHFEKKHQEPLDFHFRMSGILQHLMSFI
jgi:hypothetical protein